MKDFDSIKFFDLKTGTQMAAEAVSQHEEYNEREIRFADGGYIHLNASFSRDPSVWHVYSVPTKNMDVKKSLDWIRHVSNKPWVTKNQLSALIMVMNIEYGSGY